MKIALLTPSRGRPLEMKRNYESAMDTAAQPAKVKVWLALEWEDPERANYFATQGRLTNCADICWTSYFGNAVAAWNMLYKHSEEEIVMMNADDVVFESKGWDDRFREELEADPLQVLHYKDDLRDERQVCNPVTTRSFFRTGALPYYIHPDLRHMYADTWIEDIARRAGAVKYLGDVHIPQRHFKNNLAPFDATYARVRHEGYLDYAKKVWDRTEKVREVASERLKLMRGSR